MKKKEQLFNPDQTRTQEIREEIKKALGFFNWDASEPLKINAGIVAGQLNMCGFDYKNKERADFSWDDWLNLANEELSLEEKRVIRLYPEKVEIIKNKINFTREQIRQSGHEQI